MNFLKKRKGSTLDLIVVMVFVFVLGISVVLGYMVLDQVTISANSTGVALNQTIMNQGKATLVEFDYLTVFILFGLGFAAVLSAFFIRTHPAFFVISFFLLLFIILIATVLSNAYQNIMTTSALAPWAGNFPMIFFVFQNMPSIMLVLSLVIAVVMYAKSSSNVSGY